MEESRQPMVNDPVALLTGCNYGDSLPAPEDINQVFRRHHHGRVPLGVRYGISCHLAVDRWHCPSSHGFGNSMTTFVGPPIDVGLETNLITLQFTCRH